MQSDYGTSAPWSVKCASRWWNGDAERGLFCRGQTALEAARKVLARPSMDGLEIFSMRAVPSRNRLEIRLDKVPPPPPSSLPFPPASSSPPSAPCFLPLLSFPSPPKKIDAANKERKEKKKWN